MTQKYFSMIGTSVLIAAVLFIQSYSAVLRRGCAVISTPVCKIPDEPALYPFLDYPMYSDAWPEGSKVNQFELIAIFEDGSEKKLAETDFGLSPYWFQGYVISAFQKQRSERIQQYLGAYQAEGNLPFTAFRVDNRPMLVTAEGIVEGELEKGDRTLIESALNQQNAPEAAVELPGARL